MVLCGLFAQLCHGFIMKSFPYVQFTSISFLGACIMLIVNHWLAFTYFSGVWYQFSEVFSRTMFCNTVASFTHCDKCPEIFQILAYFTLCLWVVPFALFVSLSANDNVLPTVNERSPLLSKFSVYANNYRNQHSFRTLNQNDAMTHTVARKIFTFSILGAFYQNYQCRSGTENNFVSSVALTLHTMFIRTL